MCCGAAANGASSFRPSVTKTRRDDYQRSDCLGDGAHFDPASRAWQPMAAAAAQQSDIGLLRGSGGVSRDDVRIRVRGVDQHADLLAQQDNPQARRHRRSRRRATGTRWRAGEAVRPASDNVTSRSRRAASRSASIRASAVPPRIRIFAGFVGMPLPEVIMRDTAVSPRWLSIVGIGEDGVEGFERGSARARRRSRDRVRRPPSPRPRRLGRFAARRGRGRARLTAPPMK